MKHEELGDVFYEIGWATASNTLNWINGYMGVTNRPIYYDTADAAGCPTSGVYTSSTKCISEGKTWTIDEVITKLMAL